MFPELEEDPLGPLVVAGVGGVDLPLPVKGVAQHLELTAEVLNVVVGHLGGVDVVFDGVVLGGQAEGVIAHGEQHIVAVHPALPGHHVHGGVGPGVAHMEALTGGVGEFHQGIEFGLVAVVGGLVGPLLQPFLLPLGLNARKIVLQSVHTSLYFCAETDASALLDRNPYYYI